MYIEFIKQQDIDSETKRLIIKCLLGTTAVISSVCIVKKILNKLKHTKEINKKRKESNNKKVCLFQKLEGMGLPFTNIKKICHLNGSELLKKIHSKEFKQVDILEAYQANALLQNNDLNFITDVIYDADVSALLVRNDNTQLLSGWPLSVKDVFSIEKYDCTQGLTSNMLHPCLRTSVVIRALKEEGAIPFIITNVCQGLQKMESSNPIFGKTINPCNHNMSCGGSSAGEGAALGSRSSLIGIGNDVGGSIRIPASYCGIYGLKPTSLRVSSRHTINAPFCDLILKLSIGPMARYIDDLITTFKVMSSERIFEMDPYSPPIPFNDSVILSKSPMKIGFYTYIGGTQAHPVPAVVRAINMAKKALENSGHQMVAFTLPNIDEIVPTILKCFLLDEGKIFLNESLKDGPIDPSLRPWVRILQTSRFMKHVLSFLYRPFNKNKSESIRSSLGASVYETWQLKEKIMAYRELVLSLMEKENIDGILCPVLPIVAPPLDTCNQLSNIDIYCNVYNALDYPAGTVPVTLVSDDDINKLNNSYQSTSGIDKQILKLQRQSVGLPVGIQCVAKPWRDETCLRIMKEISLHL